MPLIGRSGTQPSLIARTITCSTSALLSMVPRLAAGWPHRGGRRQTPQRSLLEPPHQPHCPRGRWWPDTLTIERGSGHHLDALRLGTAFFVRLQASTSEGV